MNWSTGYVTDVDYVFGYYRELHPALLRFACIVAGVTPLLGEPIRYLELGYGQGVNLNMHAAALSGTFWGTDFNPSQAGHARALAHASGADVTLLDDSFADLAARPDLPEFDVIVLHGIWTWVSEEDRRTIVDLVRRKLKVGGILYNSYNCRVGWAPAEPLRDLMALYAQFAASGAAATAGNVDSALAFCRQIADSGALYFKANPFVRDHLGKMGDMNRNYLAHEYFNHNWELMSFAQVMDRLEPAKVTYVAPARMLESIDAINIPAEAQARLAAIAHPTLRESVRDYFMNRLLRRDIYVKGPQRLSAIEQADLLKSQLFVLTTPADRVARTFRGAVSEARIEDRVFQPLLEVLADNDHAPKRLGDIHADPRLQAVPFASVFQAVMAMVGAEDVFPAQLPTPDARQRCAALNRYLCERARGNGDVNQLASPVTGGGVAVTQVQQLLLRAIDQGRSTIEDQVREVWGIFAAVGQKLVRDGRPIESVTDNIAELTRKATEFRDTQLPLLTALGVSLR